MSLEPSTALPFANVLAVLQRIGGGRAQDVVLEDASWDDLYDLVVAAREDNWLPTITERFHRTCLVAVADGLTPRQMFATFKNRPFSRGTGTAVERARAVAGKDDVA